MNIKAIKKTAVLRQEYGDYVVESPLCDRVIGAGDTPEEAWQIFHEILEETYEAYLEGKLAGYENPGRPRKGKTRFHAEVNPETKQALTATAKAMGISQGEMVEYLFSYYQANKAS